MGLAHLRYLEKGRMPANSHAYDMVGKDIQAFMALTERLAQKARPQNSGDQADADVERTL